MVQAGRRTQSSYPAFLASTNASDLTLSTYGAGVHERVCDDLFAENSGRYSPPP